jgi:hypothetical protein
MRLANHPHCSVGKRRAFAIAETNLDAVIIPEIEFRKVAV